MAQGKYSARTAWGRVKGSSAAKRRAVRASSRMGLIGEWALAGCFLGIVRPRYKVIGGKICNIVIITAFPKGRKQEQSV